MLLATAKSSMFSIAEHDEVNTILQKYGGSVIERYDVSGEEWITQSLTTAWDLQGQSRVLIRNEGLADSKCVGLSEELARVLAGSSHPLSHTPKTRSIPSTSLPRTTGPTSSVASSPSYITAPSYPPTPANPGPLGGSTLKRPADTTLQSTPSKRLRVNEVTTTSINNGTYSVSPIAARGKPGDSFLLDLTFAEVLQAMDELRYLKVFEDVDLADAFAAVFPRIPYAPSTIRRHRDLLFSTELTLVQEWQEHHSERPWREFYSLRTTNDATLDVPNRWYPTDKEIREVQEKRRRARMALAQRRQQIFNQRRARPALNTVKEEPDDSDTAKTSSVWKSSREIPITTEMESDSDSSDLSIERKLTRITKGKKPLIMTSQMRRWKGLSQGTSIAESGFPSSPLAKKSKVVEIIELSSDSDSD